MIKFRKIISLTVLSVICLPFLVAMFHPMQRAAISRQTQTSQGIPTNGLVGMWDFTTDGTDSSGNGYDATLEGDAAITGSVLVLDGTGDYADCGAAVTAIQSNEVGSVCMWFKTSVAGLQRFWSGSDDTEASAEASLLISLSSTGHVGPLIRDPSVTQILAENTTGSFGANAWHLAIFTMDTTGWILTIDDNIMAMTTATNAQVWFNDISDVTDFTVGANKDSGGYEQFFTGSISRVKVYSRVLTPAEKTAIYNIEVGEF